MIADARAAIAKSAAYLVGDLQFCERTQLWIAAGAVMAVSLVSIALANSV